MFRTLPSVTSMVEAMMQMGKMKDDCIPILHPHPPRQALKRFNS